jgi:hypothetical protein
VISVACAFGCLYRCSILLTFRTFHTMSAFGAPTMRSAFRCFCLLCAAFRLNALLWNGGQHGCRILVPNLYRYHCLWRLDCRCHDRYWLGALGTTYRPGGVDQPLSSNSRFQNPVAESVPALFSISTARTMNLSASLRSSTCVSASLIVFASSRHASA